jgi:glycosyltransferase involved in cell wall biosynthesis
MKCSVLIATHNRADDLAATLASLAELHSDAPWEVIVIDNNSTDRTRAVVESAQSGFPAPLVYLLERTQGRSAALNTGIAHARGEIVLTTDDDVRVRPDWMVHAVRALDTLKCDYVGGKVLPIWGAPPPRWLPDHGSPQWAVIALVDFGPQPIELGSNAPLGVNMAFRRDAFTRVGVWNTDFGRKAGTLLGQEVREWCLRARAAGLRGFYVPDMVVRHVIPAERLTKRYFRRWFFWRGVSRALLYARTGADMEAPERAWTDFTRVPHLAGVPRYLYRTLLRRIRCLGAAWLRRDPMTAFQQELWIWFFAGIVKQRWKDRRLPRPAANAAVSRPSAGTAGQNVMTNGLPQLDATVLICTYNRADFLGGTLDSLAAMKVTPPLRWDILVVDNNSNDHTADLVRSRMASFPVPLRYLFEAKQGKSYALNTGLAASPSSIIAFTDDDVRVAPEWLTRIVAAFKTHNCDYVGGRVLPRWEAPPPRWLPSENSRLWAPLAILDYGPAPMKYGQRIPLGVNMAVKKSAIDRIGGFDPRMGRQGNTLLGQEQREWCLRAHAAGLVGYYVPDIVVQHWVPRDRLSKRYFRRWFYWRGISRARLYAQMGLDMESPAQTRHDFTQVPHLAGVPRYLFRTAAASIVSSLRARVRGDAAAAFDYELWVYFFAGIVRQRWKDRRLPRVSMTPSFSTPSARAAGSGS